MIDLHTHTTASDGRCTPSELVDRAVHAGIRVLSVTDHDTTAGYREAAGACERAGIDLVPGIEITAVREAADVHVLGYYMNPDASPLQEFLAQQRRLRLDRVRQIVERLAGLGIVLDADAIVQPAINMPGKTVGRPAIAQSLVDGGHVSTRGEAFDRWLARGRAAFVPRLGPPPAEVIARIHEAAGIASLAHPGLTAHDEWITDFVRDGLDAIEAYHTKHAPAATARYLETARSLGLAVSGGSDYHSDTSHGGQGLGAVTLPQAAFDGLRTRAGRGVNHA